MMDLTHIHETLYARNETVIHRQDDSIRGHELAIAVQNFAQRLLARPETRWALHAASTHDFAIAFLGLLCADKDVLLIPNALPGMLDETAEHVDGFILDMAFDGKRPSLPPTCSADAHLPATPISIADRPGRITFYTSGTSRQGERVEKTLHQLEQEIVVLEGLWGNALRGTLIVSTVTHQHIYGFLFRFLWPLLAGRPFDAEPLPLLQDLAPLFNRLGPCVLVSCPAHLRRLPDLTPLASCRLAIPHTFSSGGPLGQKTALRLVADLGHAPIEIFGSTETGGVAHRCRTEECPEPAWALLPEVRM
ncbi:MAG: hypothetical protein O3C57_04250, partial [Verrucomicrobia bacterium]|nr:hypothetical protein [Verrucomicrobiota bacterium]